MLRKAFIILNLAGCALSLALLASTFFAKSFIVGQAKRHAIEKTRIVSDPLAGRIEETLARPVPGKLITGPVRDKMEAELHAYRQSPEAWLDGLFDDSRRSVGEMEFPEISNPVARKALDAISAQVAATKTRLSESLRNLILDLRIFSATNALAFLGAAGLNWTVRRHNARQWLAAWSTVLLAALIVSIFLYVDRSWAWRIFWNDHMGWSYPVLLGFMTWYLAIRILPNAGAMPPPEKPDTRS